MTIFKNIRAFIASLLSAAVKAFDVRDVLVFGGLGLLGYGLWLFRPWVGFSVAGLVLMLLGLGWLTRVVK